MIKTSKLGLEVGHLNLLKRIYKNLHFVFMVKNWILSPNMGNKASISTLTIFIQHITKSSSHWNKEKRKKIQIGEDKMKLSISIDKFNKVAG